MNRSLLTAALAGYDFQLEKIQNAIAEVRGQLGHRLASSGIPAGSFAKPKRQMSVAGRKRIAAAQKRRWVTTRANAQKAALPKRKLSSERRAALVATLAKARAARAETRPAAQSFDPWP